MQLFFIFPPIGLRMLRQASSLRKASGLGSFFLAKVMHISPFQRKCSSHCLKEMKRYYINDPKLGKFSAGYCTKVGLEMPPSNILNKDRLILVGLGAVFVGWLYFDSKKRRENVVFRKKAQEIHESVKTAQENINEGNYEEAIELYKTAVELVKSEPEENVSKSVTLKIVDQLANLAYELNNWQEAEELFKETLQRMLDAGYEKDSDMVIEASMKLAKVYAALGNTDLATEGFKFCVETIQAKIETLKEIPDDTLALFGMTLTEYGTHYKAIGRLDESERAFSRALVIAKQVLGPSHEQTSVITNDLATVYDEKGRYNKAERLVQKAIAIAKTTSPENLPAYTYNLGAILMHKGEFSRAKKALRQALRLAEENQDEETLEMIKSSMMKLDVDTS